MSKGINLNDSTVEIAKKLFSIADPYDSRTINAFNERINKTWLTKQYFSLGRNSLVLPAWLVEQLGPSGKNQNSFALFPGIGNTNYRNYIMLGNPDSNYKPIVDHKGGVVPKLNSYTIIIGTVINDIPIFTTEQGKISITLNSQGFPIVTVKWEIAGDSLIYECCAAQTENEKETLGINILKGFTKFPLVVALTPFDQNGLTQVSSISWDEKKRIMSPKGHPKIQCSISPINSLILPAKSGHAGKKITQQNFLNDTTPCESHAASWAAFFAVRSTPSLVVNLAGDEFEEPDSEDIEDEWKKVSKTIPKIKTSNFAADQMFRNSIISLRLLADVRLNRVLTDPEVQEETWPPAFVFQSRALDRVGLGKKFVRPVLNHLIKKVKENGYPDQNDQWDIQGSLILAIANHYFHHRDSNWLGGTYNSIRKVIDYLIKATKKPKKEKLLEGLMPTGNPPFINPIYWRRDYYFVHNFWLVFSLRMGATLAEICGRKNETERLLDLETQFSKTLINLIIESNNNIPYLPSGPLQQESATLIYNLYGFYPLEIFPPNFQPLNKTLEHIIKHYFFDGGFMVYQPWNTHGSYLSMQLAQMLRYYDKFNLVPEIIDFLLKNKTTPQGWTEGINLSLGTGSVGGCPNGVAAGEWINLILDLFVEERFGKDPILLKGMPKKWLKAGVAAQGIHLENNCKLNLNAKLTNNKLIIKYKYTGEKTLCVFVAQNIKSLVGASSTAANLYELEKQSGSATFTFYASK